MTPARAVLDTNTVLDWLVFGNPAALRVALEIEANRLVWLATQAMRLEFDRVLPSEALQRWRPDVSRAAAAWQRHAQVASGEPPPGPLRCRDPDDQVFIDLALHQRCTWLLTRDRQLLRLARVAAPHGLRVLTPQAWLLAVELQACASPSV